MKTMKVDHINLQVPNLDAAIAFYTEVLGFEMRDQYTGEGRTFVFLTNGEIVYEILENASVSETVMHHIAYVSEDIEKDFEYFKGIGNLVDGEICCIDFLFEAGVRYFFVKSPSGELIEYCQRK